MKTLTKQEVFDKVVAHARKQGEKARATELDRNGIPHTYCRYRDETGRACFIGCLIPDELYSPSLEMNPVFDPGVREVLEKAGIDTANERFLVGLQSAHDHWPASAWEESLEAFAQEQGLVYTSLTAGSSV